VSLPQLRRVRWAVRASLVLGVAASVCANVLHADTNPISQTIAAWPPLALLITVELISRVPLHRRHLAAIRVAATAAIAGIAAWVSYWHMAGVAARYGEQGSVPYLLPLSVDGLIIVASVSLVELAGTIRGLEESGTRTAAALADAPPATPASTPPATTGQPSEDETAARRAATGQGRTLRVTRVPRPRSTGAGKANGTAAPNGATAPHGAMTANGAASGAATASGTGATGGNSGTSGAGGTNGTSATNSAAGTNGTSATNSAAGTNGASATNGTSKTVTVGKPTGRGRRPVAETRALAAQLAAQQPDATYDDLARQLGISTKRLRTVLAGSDVSR